MLKNDVWMYLIRTVCLLWPSLNKRSFGVPSSPCVRSKIYSTFFLITTIHDFKAITRSLLFTTVYRGERSNFFGEKIRAHPSVYTISISFRFWTFHCRWFVLFIYIWPVHGNRSDSSASFASFIAVQMSTSCCPLRLNSPDQPIISILNSIYDRSGHHPP